MKFLCDQCKAKYQISDDKVAGKTVRMKCRKCGHMIEVRAAVTETSVSTATPSDVPPAPGAAAGGAGSPGKPAAPPAKPSNLPKSPLATSLSQAKPTAPRPATQRPGALTDAFKSQVQNEEAALLELASADEWYAAINGVPVGPIRIGELRRKAALGAVTEDSLVWQEGMEEWRPVKTVPDLAAMVREAATTGRATMATPEPAPVKSIPPAPLVPNVGGRPGAPRAPQPPRPAPAAAPAARSNVVPITSRLATAEKLEEAPPKEDKKAAGSGAPPPASERFSVAPDPFAMGPGAGVALQPAATPPPAAAASLGTPLGAPAPSVAQPIVIQQKGPPNYIGIGMVLMMMVFGGVGAWALFFKPPPAPQAPAPVQTIIVHDQAPAPVAPAPSESIAAAPTVKPTSGKSAPKPAPAAASTGAAPLNIGDLVGGPPALQLPTGPGISGGGPTAGGGLSEGQIEQTVNRYKLGVRRTCWERGSSGVNNAQINVNVKINGQGRVTSATSTGNDAVTGKCLENEIMRWQFPGGPGEVNIPFKFVRQ